MNVTVLGGGPAGLYYALLHKKERSQDHVTLYERNAPDDTFGWGVVFSDQTLENFRQADEETYVAITDHFAHWDDIDIHVRGRTITSGGHGFSGIARKALLQILQRRAESLGVTLHYRTELPDVAAVQAKGGDLIVAADGVNSMVRRTYAREFGVATDARTNRYIWLGTSRLFDAFTFIILETPTGVYQVHAYRFDTQRSTFIVECDEASWYAAGFDQMNAAETIARCEEMFAKWLGGHRLEYNATPHRVREPWGAFHRITCERWRFGNIALVGDAAHTAHFSIGSGTKLAMEDAIALAREVTAVPDQHSARGGALTPEMDQAIDRYQAQRITEALRIQNAARNSMEWFEHVKRYVSLEPEQFAYSLLTRSQRVSHENLRLRDAAYLDGVERWFASGAEREAQACAAPAATGAGAGATGAGATGTAARPTPPLFTPLRLRGMTVENRIVVSPMDMYCATDGTPNDFHLVHYGARAMGGAGLVMTEMTCVSPEGRITLGCTGMYHEGHATAWQRVTNYVHQWSRAKIALQLGHSGRKGATALGLEGGDTPLDAREAWEVIAPSAIPYRPTMQVPRAMSRADMDQVVHDFTRAVRLAIEADFDMLELHCAHGYLLSSFLSPLANRRTDAYGGAVENRVRFPVEVFRAVREVWPQDRPISVRISATDWVEGGVTGEESVSIARAFLDAGADIIHVSTGQVHPEQKPVYGRMWQTPFSDRIRNELGARTIAVGNITEADQVNSIIAAGRADLCALGRPHLSDPHWTLRAAASLGHVAQHWPPMYRVGKSQLERQLGALDARAPR
ncbi:MAG: bifunctional salicylyl-CoA 5-hydroxylase/oxidoreductase [Gemmatimonadaceae bacterium]|nr:bifunctional salicylyl-CoA 5-hydroxylase/oxidoreductase [Gemmatimonadaceae bacterium]